MRADTIGWQVVLTKRWFNNHKRKQFCRPAVKTEKESKGKSVIEKGTKSSDSTCVDRNFTGGIHLQENEVEHEYECLLFDQVSFKVTRIVTD